MNTSKESSSSNKKPYAISGILYHNNKNRPVQEQTFGGFITIEGAKYNIRANYAGKASNGYDYFRISAREEGQNIYGALFIENSPTERGPVVKAELHSGDAHWKVSGFQKVSAKGGEYLSLSERIVGTATAAPPASPPAAKPIPPKPAVGPSPALASPSPAAPEPAGDPWALEPEPEPAPAPQEAVAEVLGINPFDFDDDEAPSPEIAEIVADLENVFDEMAVAPSPAA